MEKPFGKYTLLDRLGGGGMAEVFKARLQGPEGFEKLLALKLILPHISDEPEFVKMFIREATLAARLDHANIVRIHEFDQVEGRYYIAMELVNGKDLRQVMARAQQINRPVRIQEALQVAIEVAKGLAFAHGELTPGSPEIIHRDISPHNIIISAAGEVKITDFGIAKMASAGTVTRTGVIKGKAAYMSPEQARGTPVDRRSDLFSLGCVLWEMLTGYRLFTGDNDVAILEKLQRGPIHRPSAYNPEVPVAMDELLLRLLERESEKRIDSASAAARGLDRILMGLPDTSRSIQLVDLYQDLFSVPRAQTGLLQVQDQAGRQVDEAQVARASSGVLPVGPDVKTLGERPEAAPVQLVSTLIRPRRIRRLRWTLGLLLAGALFAAILFGLVKWSAEPKPIPTVLPAAPARLSVQSILPVPAESEPLKEPPPPPRKTESTQPKPAVHPGRLSLNAIPWARVYWRKKLLGDTPLENVALPPGTHSLLLVNKTLRIEKTIQVRIVSDQTTQQTVDLKK